LYQVSLDISRGLNDKRAVSIVLIYLGDVWRKIRNRDRALACWQEALPILRDIQDDRNIDLLNRWMKEA
jgi:hypothetical protein